MNHLRSLNEGVLQHQTWVNTCWTLTQLHNFPAFTEESVWAHLALQVRTVWYRQRGVSRAHSSGDPAGRPPPSPSWAASLEGVQGPEGPGVRPACAVSDTAATSVSDTQLLGWRSHMTNVCRHGSWVILHFLHWVRFSRIINFCSPKNLPEVNMLKGNSGIFKLYFWHEIRSSTHREQFGKSWRPSEDI